MKISYIPEEVELSLVPSTPTSNYRKLYHRDGNLFTLDSSGNEFIVTNLVYVNHTSHGYSITTHPLPAYQNVSGTWNLADASTTTEPCSGIIINIVDANNYIVQVSPGIINFTNSLSTTQIHYLDESAGGINVVSPGNSQPIFNVISNSLIQWFGYQMEANVGINVYTLNSVADININAGVDIIAGNVNLVTEGFQGSSLVAGGISLPSGSYLIDLQLAVTSTSSRTMVDTIFFSDTVEFFRHPLGAYIRSAGGQNDSGDSVKEYTTQASQWTLTIETLRNAAAGTLKLNGVGDIYGSRLFIQRIGD